MKKSYTLCIFSFIISLFLTACDLVDSKNNNDDSLNIISFNIRQSRMGDQDAFAWEQRKEAVLKMMKVEQPDILGLQEVQIEQLNYLEENSPLYNRIGVGRDDGKEGDEHAAIFYRKERFNLLSHGDFWLSETPDIPSLGWDAACKRIVTWGNFQDRQSEQFFFVFNTHFDHVGTTARKESVLLIIQKIKEIAGDSSIVILTGDLNTTIEDEIFLPLNSILKNARTTAHITDQEGTFNNFGLEDNPKIIDFIFYKGLIPTVFQTLKTDYGVSFISDHYPVKTLLNF